MSFRVAILSDLHCTKPGCRATKKILDRIQNTSPSAVVLCGDIADFNGGFEYVVELASHILKDSKVGIVSGNHDLWTHYWNKDKYALPELDKSDHIYFNLVPQVCAAHGNVYCMDAGEFITLGSWLLAGNIAWYDYSYKYEQIPYPDEYFVTNKAKYTNDGIYLNLSRSDQEFSALVLDRFKTYLSGYTGHENLAIFTHVPVFKESVYLRPMTNHQSHSFNVGSSYYYNFPFGDYVKSLPETKFVASGHVHADIQGEVTGTDISFIIGASDYGYPKADIFEFDTKGNVTRVMRKTTL